MEGKAYHTSGNQQPETKIIMNDLKAFLSSAAGQHIQQVYLNDKMEWLFAPRPGFETMVTREEVLANHAGNPKAPAKQPQPTAKR
jgi:hypothetical protein